MRIAAPCAPFVVGRLHVATLGCAPTVWFLVSAESEEVYSQSAGDHLGVSVCFFKGLLVCTVDCTFWAHRI